MEHRISLRRTPGGIPVIIERLPYLRSVAIAVNLRVGSRDELPKQCGIAHLLEHTMFKGTKAQSAKQIADMIEGAGGELNGMTTKEMTSYHVFSLDETIKVAQGLLSDMMLHPLMDEDHLEVEKAVVAQEIGMLEEEPEDYARVLLDQSIWRGHPMSYSESGQVECVTRINVEDLRAFREQHYGRENLSIVACGNLDPRQVMEWASERFDDIPLSHHRHRRVPPHPRSSINVFPKEGDQAYVELGFPSYEAKHPRRLAGALSTVILGAGTSSRLYQRIREEAGLVYQIFMAPQTYSDCGLVETYFSCSDDNIEKVVRLVGEEIHQLKEDGPRPGELERAKRWLKGMFLRKLEDTENRMFWIGEHYLLTGKVMPIEEHIANFDKITEDEVAAAANELFCTKRLCVAIHAPEQRARQAAKNIRGLDF